MAYDCQTDEELLHLLKNNDQAAFTEIYHRYWKIVFAVAANRINDLLASEEIVQDIFTDLWIRRHTINIAGMLRPYLSVAVKYKVLDRRLKQSRKIRHHENAVQQINMEDTSTQQTVDFNDLKDHLALFVADLPEKCRLIYQLSREDGYSNKQVACQLHVSEKTVEYHLSRAVKTLRIKLEHLLFLLNCLLPFTIPGFFDNY